MCVWVRVRVRVYWWMLGVDGGGGGGGGVRAILACVRFSCVCDSRMRAILAYVQFLRACDSLSFSDSQNCSIVSSLSFLILHVNKAFLHQFAGGRKSSKLGLYQLLLSSLLVFVVPKTAVLCRLCFL